ncbi:MAG: hypothetical protein AB1486_22055 [Planctomycetota bacterium]
MSSPHGDVSNSDRNRSDLPVFTKTYTVYHYNYQRSSHEAVENHTHQIEHLLNWVDGRDRTPLERCGELLVWGKFVGSDASHKIVTQPARCGGDVTRRASDRRGSVSQPDPRPWR